MMLQRRPPRVLPSPVQSIKENWQEEGVEVGGDEGGDVVIEVWA